MPLWAVLTLAIPIYAEEPMACPKTIYTSETAKSHIEIYDDNPRIKTELIEGAETYCIVNDRGRRNVAEKGVVFNTLPYRFEHGYENTAYIGEAAKKDFSTSFEEVSVSCFHATERCRLYPVESTQHFYIDVKAVNNEIHTEVFLNDYALMLNKYGTSSNDKVDKGVPIKFTLTHNGLSVPLHWPAEASFDDMLAHGTHAKWDGHAASNIVGIMHKRTGFSLTFQTVSGKEVSLTTDGNHAYFVTEVARTWMAHMLQVNN